MNRRSKSIRILIVSLTGGFLSFLNYSADPSASVRRTILKSSFIVMVVFVLISIVTAIVELRKNGGWLSRAWSGIVLLAMAIEFGLIAWGRPGSYVSDWRYGAMPRSQFLLPAGISLALGIWGISRSFQTPEK
jgi:hypothetical protein